MKIIRQLKLPNNIRNRYNEKFWDKVNDLNFYKPSTKDEKDEFVKVPYISSKGLRDDSKSNIELTIHFIKETRNVNVFLVSISNTANPRDIETLKKVWIDMQIMVCDINKWEYQIEGI
jgi:hypothetical protein